MSMDADATVEAPSGNRRRTILVAILVTLLIGVLLATVASADVPPPNYYGANIQDLIKDTFVPPSGWNQFIATMGTNDLNTARMDAEWSWVEPSAPVNGTHTYIWNNPNDSAISMDHLVGMLAQNGVRMSAVLDTPPAWAGDSSTVLAPAHYADFAAFSAAFAARYGVGGTFWTQNPQLPYLPVESFEIWNEANSSEFWTTVDPTTYLALLEPTSVAMHAADPSAQVLASIGWQNFQQYTTELYQDGVMGYINGIGFHPYAPDAPGIVLLTEQMRQLLNGFGDTALPIDITEIGQPDATSGPGAQYAWAGPVSDAARAATLSLAGDALAHGDCNVQSFDLYGLVASGTDLEQYGQGYMSLFDYTTDTPNATGSAIVAASQRWIADPAQGLVQCGTGTTPAASLLPLGLTLTHTGPTCISANVTYYGNPIESAELILETDDGRVDPAGTDAFGNTQMCLQDGPLISSFNVYAEISSPSTTASLTAPNMAISPVYNCVVTTTTPSPVCTLGQAPTAYVPPPVVTTAVALRKCSLNTDLIAAKRKHAKLKARLTCKTGSAPVSNARVYLQRKGKRTKKLLLALTLGKAQWRTFNVKARLYAGDRVIVKVAASTAIGLPAVQHTITGPKRLGSPRKSSPRA